MVQTAGPDAVAGNPPPGKDFYLMKGRQQRNTTADTQSPALGAVVLTDTSRLSCGRRNYAF